MTRQEIELNLERGLVNKTICFEPITGIKTCGRLHRLAIEYLKNELMVTFILDRTRYSVDLTYFVENTTICYGDNYTGDKRSIRRVLKGD